jgi:S1-C subfamily serine protease
VDDTQGNPDIILKVNGQPARTRTELRQALATVKAGEIVTLTVLSSTPDGWQQRIVRVRAAKTW